VGGIALRHPGGQHSLNIVAFFSIWGAVHQRGPFAGVATPLDDVRTLQLFFLTASSSFMVLAALVEEHQQSLRESRESEQRFRLVANTAPVMIWMSGPDKLFSYFNQPGWISPAVRLKLSWATAGRKGCMRKT
jgi:hypothetical protein